MIDGYDTRRILSFLSEIINIEKKEYNMPTVWIWIVLVYDSGKGNKRGFWINRNYKSSKLFFIYIYIVTAFYLHFLKHSG